MPGQEFPHNSGTYWASSEVLQVLPWLYAAAEAVSGWSGTPYLNRRDAANAPLTLLEDGRNWRRG
jgi:hypothetical protein